MSNALWMTSGPGVSVGTATIAAATDLLTITAHGLANGQQVRVDTITGGGVGVLVEGAPYFVRNVTANAFQVSGSPGGQVMLFTSDGGCAVYKAAAVYGVEALRPALGGLMAKPRISARVGEVGRFGARPGVIRNASTAEVSLNTSTGAITVHDLNAILCPVIGGTQSGPYLMARKTASPGPDHTLTAAAGSTRYDILIAEILDDGVDGSGDYIGRTRLIDGTPGAGVPPATPEGTLLLSTFTVPVSPALPSMDYDPEYTGAAGMILTVKDSTRLPDSVRWEGLYADVADVDALVRFNGSGSFDTMASAKGFQYWQTVYFDSTASFLKSSYAGARAVRVKVQAGGGGGGNVLASPASEGAVGGGGGGGGYAESWLLWSALSSSTTVTVGAGGAGGAAGVSQTAGSTGGASSFGSHVTTTGGSGGNGSSSAATQTAASGGTGGSGTGQHVITGDDGRSGRVEGGSVNQDGDGGGSAWGGARRAPSNTGAGSAGSDGKSYGGGGTGAVNGTNNVVSAKGGDGAAGRVVVEIYV